MSWRDDFKGHPAADLVPMMSGEELAKLGEDIKANDLKHDIVVWGPDRRLIDGRNRLEAMERAGVPLDPSRIRHVATGDPHDLILSMNRWRRHLTKAQQADVIVAVKRAKIHAAKLGQPGPVSKGGRGKRNPLRQEVVEECKQSDICESTAKRALARAERKTPLKRHSRTNAEKALDNLLGGYRDALWAIGTKTFSGSTLDLLTGEQNNDLAEDVENAITSLMTLRDQLRQRRIDS